MQENNKKPVKLRLFNGRGHGLKYGRYHVYVAAKSIKQAAELVGTACFGPENKDMISTHEINVYYSKDAWGIHMEGIIPTEPCVYVKDDRDVKSKPFRVI